MDGDALMYAPGSGFALYARGLALWLYEAPDGSIRLARRSSDLDIRDVLAGPVPGEALDGWSSDGARGELTRLWGQDRGASEYHAVVWRIVSSMLGILASHDGAWRWALARDAIKWAAGEEPGLAGAVGDKDAEQRLADAVGRSLSRFGAEVREPLLRASSMGTVYAQLAHLAPVEALHLAGGHWRAVEAELDAGGVLWLDEAGAAWLEREATGAWGRRAADGYREAAKDRADGWREQLALPGCERDAGALWRAWFAPDEHPVPSLFARDLARVLWLDEVGPAWARSDHAELALSRAATAQLVMLGGPRKPARRELVHGVVHDVYEIEGGRSLLVEAPIVSGDVATLADGAGFGIGLNELRVLHYVALTFYEAARSGEPWNRLQRLRIAKGRNLAIRLGMGDDGKASKNANEAVLRLSRVNVRDRRGNLVGLWGRPDEEAAAPGREASFILPLRELMLPYQLRRLEDYRVLVPLPDALPDDAWLPARRRADLARLAFGMAGAWRDRAGERHGAAWLDRPGLPLTDALWRDVGHALDRDEALERLAAVGWWSYEGGLLVPGPALPLMGAALLRSAELAKAAKAAGRMRGKRKGKP